MVLQGDARIQGLWRRPGRAKAHRRPPTPWPMRGGSPGDVSDALKGPYGKMIKRGTNFGFENGV